MVLLHHVVDPRRLTGDVQMVRLACDTCFQDYRAVFVVRTNGTDEDLYLLD